MTTKPMSFPLAVGLTRFDVTRVMPRAPEIASNVHPCRLARRATAAACVAVSASAARAASNGADPGWSQGTPVKVLLVFDIGEVSPTVPLA